jgi:uncharacterized protein involved in exopolysaccharide biosynthesis
METFQNKEQLDTGVNSYARAARNHWLPALLTFLAVVALATVAALRQESTFRASSQLLFRVSRTPILTGLAEGAQEIETLVNTQNPLVTEAQIITSQPLLAQVVDTLDLTDTEGTPLEAAQLRQNLGVEILAGADIIEISYDNPDPEKAAAIVNALTDAYIQGNYESTLAEATRARELIDQQLPQAEAFLQRSEESLRQFKQDNNIVLLETQAQSIVELMQSLDGDILQTQAELQSAAARSGQLRSNLGLSPQEAIVASDLSESSGVQGALSRLQEVDQNLAVERGFYTDNSPSVETLRNQQANLQQLLQREINTIAPGSDTEVSSRNLQVGEQRQQLIASLLASEAERQSLENRLAVLENARVSYNGQAALIPSLEQRQAELNSQVLVARTNYENLLNKQQELKIAESQASGNVTVLEPASVPDTPLAGKKLVIIAAGVLVGALLSTTVIFLLEMGDSGYARNHS